MARGNKKLDDKEREEFYDVQIEALKKLDIDIDFSELKDRLMNEGNIYVCDELHGFSEGMFHPATNSIFIYENDSFGVEEFLHETIHKATGPSQCNKLPSFFVEGGAESIAQKAYGSDKISKIVSNSLKTKEGGRRTARYNFYTDSVYHNEMCLLKQIEHAVGYSADKDVLSGTKNILDDFSRKYGKDVLIYAKHVGNQITRGKMKGSYEKMVKAQNLILERVFNKDFPEELTIEKAQEYLGRLQGMELQRARIDGDEYYKEFYEQKYKTLKQQLLEKGYELSEIEEKIPEYVPMEFYPTKFEKMIREKPISDLAARFANSRNIMEHCRKNQNSPIKQDDFRAYAMRRDDLFLEFFTYDGMIFHSASINSTGRCCAAYNKYMTDEIGGENTVYFDSESNILKFNQNGQTYEFEEVDLPEEFFSNVNARIKNYEELHQNAVNQKNTEIENSRRNLFQKIKDWIAIKKNNNRVQEEPIKDANDQR